MMSSSKAEISTKTASGTVASPENMVVNSLSSAVILSFAGGALDAFLYLNHGHIYAGVMTGNAVLLGISVGSRDFLGAWHYAWALIAYVCGVWIVIFLQSKVPRYPVRISLCCACLGLLVASFLPQSVPNWQFVFLVVVLAGFLVGIARKVDSSSYNVTVITGSLRDATIALYRSLNPLTRAGALRKVRDLWTFMLSFVIGASSGGVLAGRLGNKTLWLPVVAIAIVLIRVCQSPPSQQSTLKALQEEAEV